MRIKTVTIVVAFTAEIDVDAILPEVYCDMELSDVRPSVAGECIGTVTHFETTGVTEND